MLKKIFKCICKVDTEGDDDGVSKPVSEVTDEATSPKSNKKTRKQSLLTPPKTNDKQNKSASEDKNSLPSTQDIEIGQNDRKSLSPIGSIHELEPKIEKKEDIVIWEVKEEEELDVIYGTKLLNKRKISKRDLVEIFS